MKRISEKIERRVGIKLGLKAERCLTPKCAVTRRPSVPGVHGMSKSRRRQTERGKQMIEKKKIAALYGLSANSLKTLFSDGRRIAVGKGGNINAVDAVVEMLERRLDSVVFRMGFAPSRIVARQLVSHGHVVVNDRKVDVPSYRVPVGATVTIRLQSRESAVFKNLERSLTKYQAPSWVKIDVKNLTGTLHALPSRQEVQAPVDMAKVAELYSRS